MVAAMSKKEKSTKIGLKSIKEIITDDESRIMTFESYFRLRLSKDSNIRTHHKAPMQQFAESKGVINATEAEFNKLFDTY